MNTPLTLYTLKGCPFCAKAKDLLQSAGIEFVEIQINGDDDQMWDELARKSGGMETVPQVYRNDIFLGGYLKAEKSETGDGFLTLKRNLSI